ncbi:hypothetical protein BDK51DRAFT_37773 [Blyttiomyces helicus]|uniref:Uncharacterized protein n=1 Tax=Blyttiomyces helicus TaxID=388810 RepID=A0A4P9W7Z8_9FUNG|nr:hypothetical protein BDK51DRAFT_37773 [Blyttiomyces helicus]|eukprot:RKO88222.1 hypothetical protein BDK51DRAFT_37773 [Blyttiomyces helicus]
MNHRQSQSQNIWRNLGGPTGSGDPEEVKEEWEGFNYLLQGSLKCFHIEVSGQTTEEHTEGAHLNRKDFHTAYPLNKVSRSKERKRQRHRKTPALSPPDARSLWKILRTSLSSASQDETISSAVCQSPLREARSKKHNQFRASDHASDRPSIQSKSPDLRRYSADPRTEASRKANNDDHVGAAFFGVRGAKVQVNLGMERAC